MALSQATLKTKFLDMGLFGDEPAACAAWASAFRQYFASAAAGVVPVVAAALSTPQAAMASAMTGLSTTGPAAIQAGIVAFWGAMNPAATYFPASTAITPPPGIAALAVQLTAVFLANVVGSKSAADSYDAIATAIHAACSVGGQAVFPPPPGGIGPQPIA